MASLIALSEKDAQTSQYFDKQSGLERAQFQKLLEQTSTIYVGNLNFQTTESTIYSVFSDCGPINRVIMGLNKKTHEPCGFCFVEFFDRQSALNAVNPNNRFIIDNNQVRADLDRGFDEGRQYGRGHSGGQVRDEAARRRDPSRPYPRDRHGSHHRRY